MTLIDDVMVIEVVVVIADLVRIGGFKGEIGERRHSDPRRAKQCNCLFLFSSAAAAADDIALDST